jgi:hypothetical protein
MENKGTFTKILAITGTVLVWFPLLAPALISLIFFVQEGEFRLDYLMPAELFPFALAGGLLLLWAAIRARSRRAVIGWGLGLAVVLLVGSQALAVATGLASGETEATGWPWALVVGSLIAYILALIAVGVGGVLLLKDLFKQSQETPKPV